MQLTTLQSFPHACQVVAKIILSPLLGSWTKIPIYCGLWESCYHTLEHTVHETFMSQDFWFCCRKRETAIRQTAGKPHRDCPPTVFESLELSLRLKRRTLRERVQGENRKQWVEGTGRQRWGSDQESLSQCRPSTLRMWGSLRTPRSGTTEAGFAGPLARFLFPVRRNLKDGFESKL